MDGSFILFLYLCVGEELKAGDIPKPSLPSLLPKKPLPPKTNSSSLPPRRPERPPTLVSVHRETHTLTKKLPYVSESNIVIWFTCSGVKAPSLRAGLRHQILPLTGHMTLVSLTSEMETSATARGLSLRFHVEPSDRLLLCFCRCGPGRSGVVHREAESSDSITAARHRPPSSLADHHTSEFVCRREGLI